MKKGLSLLLSGCLMLGMLAGCGSSAASSAAPAESAAPAASEAATAAPAPAASEAETSTPETGAATTNSDKTWVIATDTVFKPFEYTDESGNFVGIDVDIVAAIAEDQGFKYELKSLGWDAAIAACQAGQADGMIAGASITGERKESGWMFSDGYYTATQCMAVAENSDIKGFEDLKDKQVAVKTGTQGASYAESLKDEYGFTLNYFEDSPTMYQAVAGGQAVACFEDTPIMAASIKDGGLGLKIVEGTENEGADYGFAVFNSDEQELLDMFNAGLANIKANGKYDEIIAKDLGCFLLLKPTGAPPGAPLFIGKEQTPHDSDSVELWRPVTARHGSDTAAGPLRLAVRHAAGHDFWHPQRGEEQGLQRDRNDFCRCGSRRAYDCSRFLCVLWRSVLPQQHDGLECNPDRTSGRYHLSGVELRRVHGGDYPRRYSVCG